MRFSITFLPRIMPDEDKTATRRIRILGGFLRECILRRVVLRRYSVFFVVVNTIVSPGTWNVEGAREEGREGNEFYAAG